MIDDVEPEVAELVGQIIDLWPNSWLDPSDVVVRAHIGKLAKQDFSMAFQGETDLVRALHQSLGHQRFVDELAWLLNTRLYKQRQSRRRALESELDDLAAKREEQKRLLRHQQYEAAEARRQEEEKQRALVAADQHARAEAYRLQQEELERQRLVAEERRLQQEALRLERESAIRDFESQAAAEFEQLLERSFLTAEKEIRARYPSLPVGYSEYQFDSFLNGQKIWFVYSWFERMSASGRLTQIPDKAQLRAIANLDRHQLIKARAGSGKTATVVNAALFLVEHCCVNPAQMLMVAFNRKAAGEIGERLFRMLHADLMDELQRLESRSTWTPAEVVVERHRAIEGILKNVHRQIPNTMTFHALGYRIAQTKLQLKMDKKGERDSPELSLEFHAVVEEMKQDSETLAKIRRVLESHFKADVEDLNLAAEWATTSDAGRDRIVRFLQATKRRTLRGEYVKSRPERWIADYLFLHGHKYFYEYNQQWNGQSSYRPDFTVRFADGRQLTIEYFGRTDDAGYAEQTESKIRYLENLARTDPNRVNLYLYPDDVGLTFEQFEAMLDQQLAQRGLARPKLDPDAIWSEMSSDWLSRFDEAVSGFVQRAKSQMLSPEDLRARLRSHVAVETAEVEFVELAIEAYEKYEARLIEMESTDFANILMAAADKVAEGGSIAYWERGSIDLSRLRYVFVDEFQDFSPLFDNLMREIRLLSPGATFTCVGDDWQAINGWAGASTTYFDGFSKSFDEATTTVLSTNYRSGQSVVEIGNHVMSGNGEPATVPEGRQSSVAWALVDGLNPFDSETALLERDYLLIALLRIVRKVGYEHNPAGEYKRIVLLSHKENVRVSRSGGAQLESLTRDLQKQLPKELAKRIRHSTIHSFKGNEGDVVILLDALSSEYPFIHPNWTFTRILGDSLASLIDAERRLLYVALTRAKCDLIFMSSSGNQPEWLRDFSAKIFDWLSLPPAVDSDRGNFYLLEVTGDTYIHREILKAEPFRLVWNKQQGHWWRQLESSEAEVSQLLVDLAGMMPHESNTKLNVAVRSPSDGSIQRFVLSRGFADRFVSTHGQ